jgi:hypothetical protein
MPRAYFWLLSLPKARDDCRQANRRRPGDPAVRLHSPDELWPSRHFQPANMNLTLEKLRWDREAAEQSFLVSIEAIRAAKQNLVDVREDAQRRIREAERDIHLAESRVQNAISKFNGWRELLAEPALS